MRSKYTSPLVLIFFFLISMQAAVMAIVFSTLPLWLEELGFSPKQLANLISAEALMRPVGFALALWLSMRGERRLLAIGCLVLLLGFVVSTNFHIFTSYPIVLLVIVLTFVCYWMIVPLAETAGMRVSMDASIEFGRIVFPGSIVFFLVLLLGGWGFDRFGLQQFPKVFSVLLGLQCIALVVYRARRIAMAGKNKSQETNRSVQGQSTATSRATPETQPKVKATSKMKAVSSAGNGVFTHTHKNKIENVVLFFTEHPIARHGRTFFTMLQNNKNLMFVFIGSMCVFSALSAHGAYSSLAWSQNSWSTTKIGVLWGTGQIGELFMLMMYASSKKTEVQLIRLAYISVFSTAFRLFATGYFIEMYAVQLLLQTLHVLGFTAMHLVVVGLIERYAKQQDYERWQSFYFLLAFGVFPAIVVGVAGKAFVAFGAKYYYGLGVLSLLGALAFFMLKRHLHAKKLSSFPTRDDGY